MLPVCLLFIACWPGLCGHVGVFISDSAESPHTARNRWPQTDGLVLQNCEEGPHGRTERLKERGRKERQQLLNEWFYLILCMLFLFIHFIWSIFLWLWDKFIFFSLMFWLQLSLSQKNNIACREFCSDLVKTNASILNHCRAHHSVLTMSEEQGYINDRGTHLLNQDWWYTH